MTRALLMLALTSPLVAAEPWPVFRGDAAMTGVAPATAKLPAMLDEVWRFDCGDAIEGAPAIASDMVFVASMDRNLYAIDYKTGQQKWKTQLGAMKAGPAFHNGRIYVGDLEGKFYCVKAATGKKLWTFETQGEIQAGANFIGDDILIGSHDATLYRLTPDGKKVWAFQIDGPVNGAAAVNGQFAFVAGCDSLLHAVDVNTGKATTSVDLGGQAGATAAIAGDSAYVGTMANQVRGIDWKAGKASWTFESNRRQQPFYASAAVTPGLVIVGGRDKKLRALDRTTGKEIWSVIADGNFDASPVVVGDRVYVGTLTGSGDFLTVSLTDGRVLQTLPLGSPVMSSAAVGPDALVVGTDKGAVVKLGAK